MMYWVDICEDIKIAFVRSADISGVILGSQDLNCFTRKSVFLYKYPDISEFIMSPSNSSVTRFTSLLPPTFYHGGAGRARSDNQPGA